ncbi:MAG: hypothetical protein ACE5KZ_01360 [Candidatus Scalinduaceae bacterium]
MYRNAKLIIVASFLGLFLFGFNAYAGKSVDWPGFAHGATSLAVIEGKIKSIDLEKMEIKLEGCDLLGDKPLMLSKDTVCYIGAEADNIKSIRGGTLFEDEDKISFNQLKVGHNIKCNYSMKDEKFWAVRIIRIFPHAYHIFTE